MSRKNKNTGFYQRQFVIFNYVKGFLCIQTSALLNIKKKNTVINIVNGLQRKTTLNQFCNLIVRIYFQIQINEFNSLATKVEIVCGE